MAFATPIPGSIVLTQLAVGEARLVTEEPVEAEAGWDSMERVHVIRALNSTEALELIPARGAQLDGQNLWVTSRRIRRSAADIYEARSVCQGMISDRGYKASITAAGQTVSITDFYFAEEGITTRYSKAQVLEQNPAVALQYIVVGARPDTTIVGTASEPPEAYRPGTKTPIWASLATPTFHYPYGWLLLSRDVEGLAGVTGVWLVTDRYQYQTKFTP
jgi:hypothetical protein